MIDYPDYSISIYNPHVGFDAMEASFIDGQIIILFVCGIINC